MSSKPIGVRRLQERGAVFHCTALAAARVREKVSSSIDVSSARVRHFVKRRVEPGGEKSSSLASHIFVSRRRYRTMSNTKSGKRHHLSARLSWQKAMYLGFRGDLREEEELRLVHRLIFIG